VPRPVTRPATIWDSIAAHAQAPERDALVIDGCRTTYGALAANVAATATALRSAGVHHAAHPRVGILMDPGAAFFEAFLGAGVAGAAAMVLQDAWSERDLDHALALGRPALVLAAADRAERVARHLPERVVVPVGSGGVAGSVASMMDRRSPSGPRPRRNAHRVDSASAFYIGFTSGSTGRPKGFVRSHRSWLRSFDASAAFGIDGTDHVLAPGPLDHSLFLYAAVHGLSVGATVHLHRRFVANAVLDTLARHPISHVYLVPTMLAALLRAADRGTPPQAPGRRSTARFVEPGPTTAPPVRTVICSGARWPAATLARVGDLFPNAAAIDFYGASETSFISLRRPDPADARTCVGRPFPGVEVAVRRSDGSAAATGETGRLWVRSDMVFSGYLDAAEAGAEWDGDGWLTIGDLAHLDDRGRLHLTGRETAMLVCGGVNVFPEEIEAVLLEVPEVAEAAVAGIPDDYWGDRLCAIVRWHDGRALPRRRLREHCRAHLARGKRPQRWLEVDDFPRTVSGKIARGVLTEQLRAGALAAAVLP
jgi:long-chain acyl-CoA synthetase